MVPTGYHLTSTAHVGVPEHAPPFFYRAAIRYRPVAQEIAPGADADGDVEKGLPVRQQALRGVTGDAGQRGHSAGRAGVYRWCRPYLDMARTALNVVGEMRWRCW